MTSQHPSVQHSSGTEPGEMQKRLGLGLDRLMNVSADRVFREPVHLGDTVVIPAASIANGYGFGFGSDNAENGGGGGGGWNDARPVAVIEAGPAGVRVKPVVDFTRIGLTVIAAAITVWRATRR
jgi:uncharacterized spore protein YtfJ